MSTAPPPRRLRADAARNRQALIDAAERLFTERGLSVTLDDIAAEAGVNVATAYRHFENKHELAGAFVQQQIDEALAIAQAAADDPDPQRGLTEFLGRTVELMAANRGLHDVITAGYADEWLERLDERFEPLLARIVARGQRAGTLRGDVSAGDLGVILNMLATVGDIPAEDQATLLRRYVELTLSALRPSDVPLPGSAPTLAQAHQAALPRRGRAQRAAAPTAAVASTGEAGSQRSLTTSVANAPAHKGQ